MDDTKIQFLNMLTVHQKTPHKQVSTCKQHRIPNDKIIVKKYFYTVPISHCKNFVFLANNKTNHRKYQHI
jgi:hypothetical protein